MHLLEASSGVGTFLSFYFQEFLVLRMNSGSSQAKHVHSYTLLSLRIIPGSRVGTLQTLREGCPFLILNDLVSCLSIVLRCSPLQEHHEDLLLDLAVQTLRVSQGSQSAVCLNYNMILLHTSKHAFPRPLHVTGALY